MTSGHHIDYDALALEALRGVVKSCLAQVARTGLLGDHHFYIAFNTQAPGVSLSRRLKEKYPQEMTIVLQHRFWDLSVDDERFEVKLTFDGIPERLVIPFKSIKVFYDPSVPYGLQFEEVDPGTARDSTRRGGRRSVGLAKDTDSQLDGSLHERMPGASHVEQDETEPSGNDSPGDRRRPRRNRPEHTPAPTPAEAPRPPEVATTGSRKDGQAETAPRAPLKPVAPTPAKPAAVAAVPKDEEPTAKPDDDGSGGAKIFDLAKFRSKK